MELFVKVAMIMVVFVPIVQLVCHLLGIPGPLD